MGAQAWAFVGVITSITVYIYVALDAGKGVKTARQFFNDTGGVNKATISLACYNVTLGTGVAYMVAQSQLSGMFVFLTPLAMAFGYYLFARYMHSLNFTPTDETPNLYRLLSRRGGGASTLTKAYSLVISLTFTCILAFELWLGAFFISNSLFIDPSNSTTIAIAITIFLIVAIYTTMAGIRGSVQTDLYQGLMLIGFLVSIIWLAGLPSTAKLSASAHSISGPGWLATALAIVTALTTQFYSVVNANFGLAQDASSQRKMFVRGGAIAAIYYVVILLFVFGSSDGFDLSMIAKRIGQSDSSISGWVAALFAGGLVAISMSSLDNATVATSKVIYENWTSGSEAKRVTMAKFRIVHSLVAICMVLISWALILAGLSVFYTLLTILFAVSTFSPILTGAIWLHQKGLGSFIDNRSVAIGVISAVAVCWAVYGTLTFTGRTEAGSILHLAAVLIALAFAMADVRHNGKQKGIPTE